MKAKELEKDAVEHIENRCQREATRAIENKLLEIKKFELNLATLKNELSDLLSRDVDSFVREVIRDRREP